MKKIKLLLACALCIVSSLFATDIENASSSSTIVPGEWNTNFAASKTYAEANGIPLLILWSSPGCAFCNKMKTACNTSTFVSWRQTKKIVLVISEGDSTSKSFAKNSSGKFPYMRLYWPAGNVDVRFSGRSATIPASGSTLEAQLINYLNSLLKSWTGTGTGGGTVVEDDTEEEEEEEESSTPVIGTEWNHARKILGTYCDAQGLVVGRVIAVAAKVNAKNGTSRVRLQIQNELGKTKTIGTSNLTVDRKTTGTFSSNNGRANLTIESSGLSGTVAIGGVTYTISNSKTGGVLTAGNYLFTLSGYPETCQTYPVLNPETFLPLEQVFQSTGSKWTFTRKSTPKYNKSTGLYEAATTNPSGLKLSYSSSTGYFKGTFYVYAQRKTNSLRRYVATVGGYMVGTTGCGTVTIRNVGTYSCAIAFGE